MHNPPYFDIFRLIVVLVHKVIWNRVASVRVKLTDKLLGVAFVCLCKSVWSQILPYFYSALLRALQALY